MQLHNLWKRKSLVLSIFILLEHKSDMWQLDPDSMRWTQIKPRGKGPEPRRRQALCQVVGKKFKFEFHIFVTKTV